MNFLTHESITTAKAALIEFGRTTLLALLTITLIAAAAPIMLSILVLAIATITTILALAFTGLALITWDILHLLEAAGLIHGSFNPDEASYCYELFNHSVQFCTSIL